MILHDITLANTLDAAISNFRCNEGTVMHHSKRSLCVFYIPFRHRQQDVVACGNIELVI